VKNVDKYRMRRFRVATLQIFVSDCMEQTIVAHLGQDCLTSCFPEVHYLRSVISLFIRSFNFLMRTFGVRILDRNTLKGVLLVSPHFRLLISQKIPLEVSVLPA